MFADLPQAGCGSVDSFVIAACALDCDVVDMKASALAKVCRFERITFTAVKYETDGADAAAGTDWHNDLHQAADAFLARYERLARMIAEDA